MKQPPRRLRRSPLLLREGGHHQRPGEARSAVVPERASLRRSWHPLPLGEGWGEGTHGAGLATGASPHPNPPPAGQGATSPPRCVPRGWRASAMDH